MRYNKEAIIKGIRDNLNVNVIEFAKQVLAIENDDEREEISTITFSDIFKINSITSIDDCIKELENNIDKIQKLSVSEIQAILNCDRPILTKTLDILKGGCNGLIIIPEGERRGRKYSLERKKD